MDKEDISGRSYAEIVQLCIQNGNIYRRDEKAPRWSISQSEVIMITNICTN